MDKKGKINMVYKLINPSDPYTFIAENQEVAALTVFLLSTMCGAKSQDGTMDVPVLFSNAYEWYVENFNRTPEEGIAENTQLLADSLDSFLYGGFGDRKTFEAAYELMESEEKRREYRSIWNDKRTSLSNFCETAYSLAKVLRKKGEKDETES